MAEIMFKPLTVDNVFDFCSVLDAVGAESVISVFDAKEIAALQKSGKDQKGVGLALGMKVAGVILKNLPKARNEIYSFFVNCCTWDNGTAVTVEELRSFKPGKFITLIKDFSQTEDITDFLKGVAELMGTEQNDSTN